MYNSLCVGTKGYVVLLDEQHIAVHTVIAEAVAWLHCVY